MLHEQLETLRQELQRMQRQLEEKTSLEDRYIQPNVADGIQRHHLISETLVMPILNGF